MNFEKNFTDIEKSFNLVGCLPGVSILSGVVRATLGKVQLVVSGIFAVSSLFLYFIPQVNKSLWYSRACMNGTFIIHGAANIIRGYSESLLGMTLIGSIFPLVFQIVYGFDPIIQYRVNRWEYKNWNHNSLY